MAIIGRALLKEFLDHADLFDIGAIQLGNQIIPNHNGLLGRRPGYRRHEDRLHPPWGLENVVASAHARNGRDGSSWSMGSPSPRQRNLMASELFGPRFRQPSRAAASRWNPCRTPGSPRRPTCAPISARAVTASRSSQPWRRRSGYLLPAALAAGAAPTPSAPSGRGGPVLCRGRRCRRDARSDRPAGDGRRPSDRKRGFTSNRSWSSSARNRVGPGFGAGGAADGGHPGGSGARSPPARSQSPPRRRAEPSSASCSALQGAVQYSPADECEGQDRPPCITTTIAREGRRVSRRSWPNAR